MSDKLTKTQIAEQSGIHIGRTTYYFKHFPEYFEGYDVKGKIHPVYDESSVYIIKLIAELIGEKSHNEIKQALNEAGYSPVIEMVDKKIIIIEDSNNNDLRTIEDMQKNLEIQINVISILTRMNERQADIIDKLDQENRRLQKDNETLKSEIDKQNHSDLSDG